MRYPFGESKKRIWKQVSEEVDRVLSSQKRIYINESTLKRVIKNIKK
jgi:Fe-S cluster biosynthesis and repair protein YggX